MYLQRNSISNLLNHCCHSILRVFSLYFLPKYAAVNNTNIETVVMKRQKCITFSITVEIKNVSLFLYFVGYPVSQISFLSKRVIL
jgi:hypothetical protein